jgi:signal transduction histidine kinase
MKKVKLTFPWIALLLLLTTAGLFLIAGNPQLITFYSIPPQWLDFNYLVAVFAAVSLITLWDIRRFYRQRKVYETIINDLFQAKKQLQNKAHTFSSHSDRLKLFISDRLLEYIQYDEKFLHFKNIAAEVRHNGVICFDKVQTALTATITQLENSKDKNTATITAESYYDALSSMRYLWDLLDLSTTDNIALHIGNYLCECEEYYVQSLMQAEPALPFPVTYKAHKVLIDCLLPLVDKPEQLSAIAENLNEETFFYQDSLFSISLNGRIEFLGNDNHFRLLAENLINNAQFYCRKKGATKQQASISIALDGDEKHGKLIIYNRGQTIAENTIGKIFQLGYSTRRKKENHGKGLGLYFVNSIVQGYEGQITVVNIENQIDTYSIRIETESGDIITELVDITLMDNQPLMMIRDNDQPLAQLEWKMKGTLRSIEVFSKQHNKTATFTDITQGNQRFLDPDAQGKFHIPNWLITISKHRRHNTVSFAPLDRHGVQFCVTLPTAKARLDYSEAMGNELETENYQNIIALEERFKG